MLSYNNKIINIIAKNRLTIIKSVPQTAHNRAGLVLAPRARRPAQLSGQAGLGTLLVGPGQAVLVPGHARAGLQAHCRADPFGHVYSTSTCFTVY
jgi:hypothetical protein